VSPSNLLYTFFLVSETGHRLIIMSSETNSSSTSKRHLGNGNRKTELDRIVTIMNRHEPSRKIRKEKSRNHHEINVHATHVLEANVVYYQSNAMALRFFILQAPHNKMPSGSQLPKLENK
jgi:hypothetical protein